MKLINIKLRMNRATRKKIYLSIAIFSMVLNSFYPFFASYQYVHAEGEVVVEESVSTEEAESEEPSSGEEVAPSEESSSTEESAPAEEPADVPTEVQSEETTIENGESAAEIPSDTAAATIDETQQGDILPDGVSDYRPEGSADSAPATEIVTDTTDVSDPVVEVIEQVSEESVSEEIERECIAEDIVIVDSLESDWELNEESGYYETKENVKLGVKYIFPEDEKVTVTFSCLPKDDSYRSELKIQQVEIDNLNLPDEISTSAQYAYDITTDMRDGTFEYDITLPKPEGIEAEVSYIEGSIEDLSDVELTEEDIVEVSSEDINQDEEEGELEVEGLEHFTVFIVTGSVGPIVDAWATYPGDYLRYVGNPAPEGYSHEYQWEDPFYICDPNEEEVTFTGTIDVSTMSVGGVAFVGLLDKGLLELGGNGYQSGAYAYIYKTSDSNVKIGPTDGNLGGEIVQNFKNYAVPVGGSLDLIIRIHDGNVSVQVEDDSSINDTYGAVKTLNNTDAYDWDEFENGAIPGWDNYQSTDMPYSFEIDGCREVSTDKVKICHATARTSDPYIINNPNKSGDLNGHVNHIGGVYSDSPWGDIIPPFTYFECPTDLGAYISDDNSLPCMEQIGSGKDKVKKYADMVELSYEGMNWDDPAGRAIYNNNCEIPTGGYCGDGNVDTNWNEQCDDGNVVDGDGCSSTCTLEGPVGDCGDGNVNAQGEQCDDGNTNNNDYCSNKCQFNSVCLPDENMLVNGDFETPEVTNAYKWDIFNMYDPMLGWNVEWSGGKDTYNSETRPEPAFLELHRGVNGWLPKTGNQYAELDTDWDGSGKPLNGEPATVRISQDIPVLDGYKYRVDFSYSPRPEQGESNNNMDFELDGSPIENYSGSGGSNTNWTPEFYEFTADADAIRTVSFVEKGTADSLGMFLDDVKVTCLGPEEPECEEGPGWVDIVVSSKQGTLYNDDPITDPIRINPYETLGAADGDFFSLGKGGEIVLEFTSFLVNGVGDDISIHEITWNREGDIEEKAKVYVSADGSTWMYLGEASSFSDGNGDTIKDGVTYFDLDDLTEKPIWIKYVKLVEASEGQAGDDDGFDLDAVDEVYGVCEEPQPQCGNQEQEPGEECDGTDGVEVGENFCTYDCRLVPIYDGAHACTPGTYPVVYSGPFTISSTDKDGEMVSVEGGKEYLFEASGTFVPTGAAGYISDAGYTLINGVLASQYGIKGTPPDLGAHALLGNFGGGVGIIDWGEYNSEHVYTKAYTFDSDYDINFLIGDRYDNWFDTAWDEQVGMRDNKGSLSLTVYECAAPVCGNGNIDPGEECDGTDGVEVGENFCTPTCQLIPIYDGDHSCDPGTTAVKIGDTHILNPKTGNEVLVPLEEDQEYLFKVYGVYNFGSSTNRVADPAYGSEDNWGSIRPDIGIWGTTHRGVLSVLGNLGPLGYGVVEWDDDETVDGDHAYEKAFTPKEDMTAKFLISDWYDDWYANTCNDQSCLSDNSGTLSLDVYECQPAVDVTICKIDEQENNLPGWRVALLGESVDSFSVESDGTPVTKNYPVGSYVVEASGIYNYGSSVMNADAANSYRHAGLVCSGGVDGWVNGDASGCMNHYLNLNPSLSVGPTEAGWGDFFNPANIYYKAFGGGDLNLKIWDSCGTSGEGCYGDNEGNLDVTVYEGYAGDTGEDGCVTFSDVPYGIYGVVEAMQDGWANVSGLGKVDIDEPSGTITIVNRLLPTNGDLTICKYNDLNRNGEIDDNEPKIGWDMTVVDVDGGDAGETWNMATPAGDCLVLENMDLGSYEITEDQVAGWTKTFPSDSYTQTVTLDVNNPDATVNFLNYETPEVTIVATKIVCDYESDLPNYGEVGGSDITATTAADFLSTHPNCHLEEGWNFQWGDKYDTNPGDDKIGPATGWTTFGPTNTSGVATVTIGDVDTINKPLKIREELKAGYIPFTYTTSGKQNTNSVSAELYCGTDVFNYDNEEWISSLQYGQTYYCVAWNVVNDAYIQGIKFRDVNGNGVFDGTDRNIANRLDDWTIALFDKDWTLIRSADTGKDTPGNDVSKGQYRFKGLMAGKYYVCEQPETGWKQTVPALGSDVVEHNGSLCYEIDLLPGQEKIEVRFGNFELGVIQGVKFNDKDGDGEPRELNEEYMDGWKVRLYENWANPIEVTTPNTAQQGQYRFEGLEPGTYQLCEVNKGGWVQTWPSAGDVPVADNGVLHPEYGIAVINSSGAEDEAEVCWQTVISASGQEKILLRFGNAKLGDIHGYKWDDVNGDEEFNNEESKLSGWEIFIDENDNSTWDSGEPKTTTSSDPDPMHFGWYKFEGLMPGTYTVCEVVQNGWTQTFPVGGCHDVTLPYSEVELKKAEPNAISEPAPAYNFGNYYNPSLTLAKWNNVGGNMSPGDTVEFTIQVTAHGNAVNNVIVTDLFSAGFGYVDDSWSGTLTEPTYASPGVWDLGNMEKDEVRLLTYSTVISDDIDPGIYKDLAWVAGEDLLGGGVLGTSEEEGYVAENFVGTDVPVVVDTQDPEVETEVDEEEVEEEVLGTSTVRLPATGANSWVLGSVLAIMVIGISLLAVSKRKKFVAIFFGLLLFGILGGSKVYADSSLMIRVEDLESFYNKPFGVTFVAMDLDSEGERPLTAICKKDGPNDAGWVVFETLPLALGGGTDVCNVESGDLNGNGDYDFMVTLVAGEGEGEESLDSNVVSTTFDNEGPDKPKYIEVDRKSDCKYEIELKTANDGQTSYVEVYMSDEKEFTAGPGSRIRTIGIGPDEKHEFTEEVAGEKCAHRQYFAVRAFDTAGNGSDVEAEELVDVNYITVYEEGTEETIQEAYAGGAASAIGGEGTGTGGEEVILPGEEGAEGEEGSILGEQTQEEEGAVQKGFFGKLISNPWTWIVLILGLGAITINGIKKSKQE